MSLTSKFELKSTLYFVTGGQNPLVSGLLAKAIVQDESGFYYTADNKTWIKEENLYPSRDAAYEAIIKQATDEMATVDMPVIPETSAVVDADKPV